MTQLNSHLIANTSPLANAENIIVRDKFRITVLTPYLIRLEKQNKNIFNDNATQAFWYRDMPKVDFSLLEDKSSLHIITQKVTFFINKNKCKVTKVLIDNNWVSCDNKNNFLGTKRTLDFTIGGVKLGKGLLSKKGVALYHDDSLLLVDGVVVPKDYHNKDTYIFAYGKEYRKCIKDFYMLSGKVPLLPRYVLGNWWSRYKAYTQQEYMDVMQRFEQEKVPFTVATIDMDWHWVDVKQRFDSSLKRHSLVYSAGWTGYSWNTELFPNYKKFLQWLRDKNYFVTLNLHPASGIRHFEDCYEEFAKAMGIDPASKKPINFDLSDNNFINNYFDIAHRPMENDGVDFWWIDWQQGKKSTVKGLDPLWALNHYHFLDNCANNKRGVILSRYSELGSHRYPLGFSGDTFVYWRNLKFQPYFTATASNVGYGWWSHDIGGHQFGINSDELYLRWCQFGVFSPINRLHSSINDLLGKEPWKRSSQVKKLTIEFLQLRHKLIPYIYTMNYLSHTQGRSLCEPMYYSYAEDHLSYKFPNQYTFGTELIVSPIVRPMDKALRMAKTDVWLPEGRYTDIFTNKIYHGGKVYTMFRDIDSIPALAKEGAIIPLAQTNDNSIANPQEFEVLIYRGNNSFTLYEDDGVSNDFMQDKFAKTTFSITEEENEVVFSIAPVLGELSIVPTVRKYTLYFKDIVDGSVVIGDTEMEFTQKIVVDVDSSVGLSLKITQCQHLTNGDKIENAKIVLSRYNTGNLSKLLKYWGIGKIKDSELFYQKICKSLFPKNIKLAVKEAMDK